MSTYVSQAPESGTYNLHGATFQAAKNDVIAGNGLDAYTNFYNSLRTQELMNYNASEAQKNRDFQERMSNSAYQRAVQDMRKAGLNPYAVYGGAAAASTPGGSAGSYNSAYTHSTRRTDAVINHLFGIVGDAFTAASKLNVSPSMSKIGF